MSAARALTLTANALSCGILGTKAGVGARLARANIFGKETLIARRVDEWHAVVSILWHRPGRGEGLYRGHSVTLQPPLSPGSMHYFLT